MSQIHTSGTAPGSTPHVAILNAGAWGTALATLLANRGRPVRLWCRRPELAEHLAETRENTAYLPGVFLPPSVHVSADMEEVLVGAGWVILVPISRAMREVARAARPFLPARVPVAHGAKGLEEPSLLRLSQVIAQELGETYVGRVVALSGPTHAEEVARGLPTAAVVAAEDVAATEPFQQLLHGPSLRIYISPDIVGVELCAALKNVIALAIGAAEGLGYGDNARAALITRALAEIGRLVHAAGGDLRTVAGLAGLGDVVATCTSRHSRNRWAGEQIGRGRLPRDVVASTPRVIEGVPAASAAMALARRYGVHLPIAEQVYRVLYEGAAAAEVLAELMAREATTEL